MTPLESKSLPRWLSWLMVYMILAYTSAALWVFLHAVDHALGKVAW